MIKTDFKRPIPLTPNDLAFGFEVNNMVKRYPNLINSKLNTVDALELLIYIDLSRNLQDDGNVVSVTECTKKAKSYLNRVSSKQIITDLRSEKVQYQYKQKLWETVISQRINDKDFILDLLNYFDNGTELFFPLSQKKIVAKFRHTIFDRLEHNPSAIEMLYSNKAKDLDWQNILPNATRNYIVSAYLQKEENEPFYLEKIEKDRYIKLNLREKAALKNKKWTDKYFQESQNKTFHSTITVGFKNLPTDEFKKYHEKNSDDNYLIASFYLNINEWNKVLTTFQVFGIFKYLNEIGFINNSGFIQPVQIREEDGVLVRTFATESNSSYKNLPAFESRETAYLLILKFVYRQLNDNKISLEKVLNSYWNGYIGRLLNRNNFDLDIIIPTNEIKRRILNNELASQMQRAVKLWNVAAFGEDLNQLSINNLVKMPSYDEIIGLRNKTYLTLTSEISRNIEYILNSDQSILYGIDQSITFNKRLLAGDSKIQDMNINRHAKDCIEYLIDKNIIEKNSNDSLSYVNPLYSYIFSTSFIYGQIPYSPTLEPVLDVLEKSGITYKSTNLLFSSSESSYFNYVLGSYFDNSLELRNKYSHGSANGLGNEKYEDEYIRILYCFVLFTLKVSQEIDLSIKNSLL